MKIKYNKGFTLLEVLIAISILTIIIFIGYRIIDKSTIAVKNQGNINQGQLTMNDMNRYITKDLEQATSIQLLLDNEDGTDNYEVIADTKIEIEQTLENKNNLLEEIFSSKIESKLDANNSKFKYKYIIRNSTESELDDINYIAIINKEGIDIEYTIERVDENSTKIQFINNNKIKDKVLPIKITGNNPYKVNIGYTDKNNKFNKHEFKITSRISNIVTKDNVEIDADGTREKPLPAPGNPEIDDLLNANNGYIRFEYGDLKADSNYGENKSKLETGKVRVSVGGVNNNGIIDRLAYQLGEINKEKIDIYGNITVGNNNGKIWCKIDEFGDSTDKGQGFYSNATYFGQQSLNAINITVTEGAKLLNLKINGKEYIEDGKIYSDFPTGKYILTSQVSFSNDIKITGQIEKQGNSGAVIITFGNSK